MAQKLCHDKSQQTCTHARRSTVVYMNAQQAIISSVRDLHAHQHPRPGTMYTSATSGNKVQHDVEASRARHPSSNFTAQQRTFTKTPGLGTWPTSSTSAHRVLPLPPKAALWFVHATADSIRNPMRAARPSTRRTHSQNAQRIIAVVVAVAEAGASQGRGCARLTAASPVAAHEDGSACECSPGAPAPSPCRLEPPAPRLPLPGARRHPPYAYAHHAHHAPHTCRPPHTRAPGLAAELGAPPNAALSVSLRPGAP